MFGKLKARKHANAISAETAKLLIRTDLLDEEIALNDVAYLWGWFEAVDICVFSINEKMDRDLTACFLILANNLDSSCVHEMMQRRMDSAIDLVARVKDRVNSPSVIPLLAQFGADYLHNNGYGNEDEIFNRLLESINIIAKTV